MGKLKLDKSQILAFGSIYLILIVLGILKYVEKLQKAEK